MSTQAANALPKPAQRSPASEERVRRWALEISLSPIEPGRARPPRMTYEEFLAWADEDTLAEWVDGEVIT